MTWIDEITKENFDRSFNIQNVLKDSVFYPASGTDGKDIEALSEFSFSFIHVDYSISKNDVKKAIAKDFSPIGYELLGLKVVARNELTPNGFTPHSFPLNEHEKDRLNQSHIQDRYYQRDFTPFAIWAVLELRQEIISSRKIKKFSLLHIGGESIATFDALYVNNGINPLAVTIINPSESEGYGDNWTRFTDPNYRFYQLIQLNIEKHDQKMPKYVYTDYARENRCFWPDYKRINLKYLIEGLVFEYKTFN